MLEAIDLECTRGERLLFSDLRFALRQGELLRVAGPNGSGKTSLLRILCGLLQPARGEVRWRGQRIRALAEDFRRELLYLGHLNAVKDDLGAAENLRIACGIAGIAADSAQIANALQLMGLDGFANHPARHLSQGQKRRVALSRLALAAASPLWILDEPFAALDARGIAVVENLIEAQLARGHTVVLTTHQETAAASGSVVTLELGMAAAC